MNFLHLFHRFLLRPWLKHPLLPLLNVVGIALGICVFTSIQMVNRSASAAFQAGVEIVTGRADLEVRGFIDENLLPVIAGQSGVAVATPLVELTAVLPDRPGEYVRILGVDPFTAGTLRPARATNEDGSFDLEAWLREPFATAISRAGRDLFGINQGEFLRINAAVGGRSLPVLFGIEAEGPAGADPRVVLMDIGWAQELSGNPGRLSSVQLQLAEGVDREEMKERLAAVLPADLQVEEPAGRSRQTDGMVASFQLNLTALSLVSILVGMYLIYNTVSASVVRRRREIGILRSLGTGSREIRVMFLAEAGLAGLLGAILGLAMSYPLAASLTGAVSQTISSLYLLTSIESIRLDGWQILLALGLGTAAAMLAAWFPSAEALRVEPREALHPGTLHTGGQLRIPRFSAAGVLLLVLAALTGWLTLHWNFGPLGFASAFLVMAGMSLLAPLACRIFARSVLGILPSGWIETRIALQHFERSLHRNAVTIAALAAAVSMTISISVMIYSFQRSVVSWMETTLVADVFVAPSSNESLGIAHPLPGGMVEWLSARPEVGEVASFREEVLILEGRRVFLGVMDGQARGRLQFLEGRDEERSRALEDPDRIAVSESFARKFGKKAGDEILLPTPTGWKTFHLVGIYRDYTRDSGALLMTRRNFLNHWKQPQIHSVAVFLNAEGQEEELMSDLRDAFGQDLPLSMYSNRQLKTKVLEIFDQTFRVTGILRLVALIVSVAGIVLSLTTLVAEREREHAMLAAVGGSAGQICRINLLEAGCIGLLASLLGMIGGALLAVDLTWVINKAFFGWTVDLRFPWQFLLSTPLWLLPVAMLAALWPSLQAARANVAAALRNE